MIKKLKCLVSGHIFSTPTIDGKKMLIMRCVKCNWVPKSYPWEEK
jgi:hypothetical protein